MGGQPPTPALKTNETLKQIEIKLGKKYKKYQWERDFYENCSVSSLSAKDVNGQTIFVKLVNITNDDSLDLRLDKLDAEIDSPDPLAAPKWTYEILEIPGKKFLLTEKASEPKTLQNMLEHNGDVIKERLKDIVDGLIDVLKNLNSKKFFHLNIKAENISIDLKTMKFTLLDWESYICKRLVTSKENANSIEINTPPEGIERDLFCVGILILNLLGIPNTEELLNLKELKDEKNLEAELESLQKQTCSEVQMEEIRKLALHLLKAGKSNINQILEKVTKKHCNGLCQDEDAAHQENYIDVHCKSKGECKLYRDLQHRMDYWHPMMCKETNKCTEYEDDEHRKNNLHPPIQCKYKGLCTWNFEAKHLKKFLHPPLCKTDCEDYSEKHMTDYSHQFDTCERALQCDLSNNRQIYIKHLRNFRHPFRPLCKAFFNCTDQSSQHLDLFSHPCEWGKFCKLRIEGNPDWQDHCKQYVHIARNLCEFNPNCPNIHNQSHLDEYAHTNIREIRKKCKNWHSCFDNSEEHLSKFSHPHRKRMVITNLFGGNSDINFVENANYLEGMLDAL